jgi:hypothetical protein
MDYGVPPSLLMGVPSGIEGTRYTLGLMRDLARQGALDTMIRQQAVSQTMNVKPKDWNGEVAALFNFVQNKIRYVRDIDGVETLHTARRVLQNAAGDCDDKSILLAAMLKSLSHGARFHAVGFRDGNSCQHVFVEAQPGKRGPWIALDPTMNFPAGWSPAVAGRAKKSIVVEV